MARFSEYFKDLATVLGLLPSAGEKAALGGSSGTPNSGNKYVTDGDPRNTDARTPLTHSHPESDVTNLTSDLAGKAPTVHTHTEAQVTNLVSDLAAKEVTANKDADGTLTANSDTRYATQKATKTYADTKQPALGFTAENAANKDTDPALTANSDTKYASQKAAKSYADALLAVAEAYADAVASGLIVKQSVRLATAAALPGNSRSGNILTASGNGALSVDSVGVAVNDRILVKDEATGANNGIYTVTTVGSAGTAFVLTRATDADTSLEVKSGMYAFVDEGTVNISSSWVLNTPNPITLNTTALVFVQFSSAGQITAGTGLLKTGSTIDAVAGTGIVTAADSISADFGTGAGKVTQGNDSRLSDARTPTAHKTSHEPGGTDPLTVNAAAGTGSLRSLGAGATQAAAGNDSRLSDARTPTAHATSHQPGGTDALAVDAAAATGSLRTLGSGATQATSGTDSRLTNSRPPNGAASGDLAGSYPNPDIAAGAIVNADVNSAAAIAYAKLALTGAILNADLAGSIAQSKITNLVSDLAGKQTGSPDLSAIAALISATDRLPYATGAGTWALTQFTQAGRDLVDDNDAAAQRTTLQVLGKAANLSDVASAPTSRTNLGLGNVDNTSDVNKLPSTATVTAIGTVTPTPITTSTRDAATTDLGKCLDITFTGASTVTIKAVASGGPNLGTGGWLDIRNSNATGAKTIACTGAAVIRDPTTGATTTSVVLALYETVRLTQVAVDTYTMTGRYEPDLEAIGKLTSAANRIPYYTGVATASLLTLDPDITLAANLDTNVATQKAVKTYVTNSIIASATFVNILDFNAVPGVGAGAATANTTAIQNALTAAGDGCCVIPAGTFEINGELRPPGRCTVFLFGKLSVLSGFPANKAVLNFWVPAQRHTSGLLTGGGQILCNTIADFGVALDTSHGFRCSDIEINDAGIASVHVWSNQSFQGNWNAATNTSPHLVNGTGTLGDAYHNTATSTQSVDFGNGAISFDPNDAVMYDGAVWKNVDKDCDDWVFDHITHRTNGGFATNTRPQFFAVVEAGGLGGVADGTLRDCYIEGLKPTPNTTVATLGVLTGTGTGTFTVASGPALPAAPFWVSIDTEIIKISVKSGNTLTIPAGGRGAWGTTAAIHSATPTVYTVAPASSTGTGASWAYWIEDASRIKVDGKVVSDNSRQYAGGVMICKDNGTHSMEGNEVASLYVECQTGAPCIGVMIWTTQNAPAPGGGTYFHRFHKVDKLRFDTDAGAKGRRFVVASEATSAGYTTQNTYRDPRNTISSDGTILLDNATANIVEVLGAKSGVGTEGSHVTGGTTNNNNVIGLQSL